MVMEDKEFAEINKGKRYLFNDGWHPTVNPSGRMVIHHFRFSRLLGQKEGILNELPRREGGVTVRLVRCSQQGVLDVYPLPTSIRWMPWWLSASNKLASTLIRSIFEQAIANSETTPTEKHLFAR